MVCFGDKLAPHSRNTVFTGLPLPTSSGAYMTVTGQAQSQLAQEGRVLTTLCPAQIT